MSQIERIHRVGTMRFPSLRDWLHTEIRGWILADQLNDEQFETMFTAAEQMLMPYVRADGTVVLCAPAYIVMANK